MKMKNRGPRKTKDDKIKLIQSLFPKVLLLVEKDKLKIRAALNSLGIHSQVFYEYLSAEQKAQLRIATMTNRYSVKLKNRTNHF